MIIGLVPCRSGSKTLVHKNIYPLGGYPVIAYAITASLLSPRIDRTIVTTDSEEYAEIARRYGAEVPFLRPPEISTDTSTDLEYVQHLLDWLGKDNYPEYIVQLRPSHPLRDLKEIERAIELIDAHPNATSLRSVHMAERPPHKSFYIKDGYLEGIFADTDTRPEYYNLPRQCFPQVYDPNGHVDILKSKVVGENTLYGSRMIPFITKSAGEFEGLGELKYIEWVLKEYGNPIHDYLKANYKEDK